MSDKTHNDLAASISRLQNKVTDNQRSKILVQLMANGAKVDGALINDAYLPLNISKTPTDVLKAIEVHLEQLINSNQV